MKTPKRNKKHVKLLFYILNMKENNLRIVDNLGLLFHNCKKNDPP